MLPRMFSPPGAGEKKKLEPARPEAVKHGPAFATLFGSTTLYVSCERLIIISILVNPVGNSRGYQPRRLTQLCRQYTYVCTVNKYGRKRPWKTMLSMRTGRHCSTRDRGGGGETGVNIAPWWPELGTRDNTAATTWPWIKVKNAVLRIRNDLFRIRIQLWIFRIRAKVTDPCGSGSNPY